MLSAIHPDYLINIQPAMGPTQIQLTGSWVLKRMLT